MSKLYPIGTKLYTSRLSQIALYVELFGENNVTTFLYYRCSGGETSVAEISVNGFVRATEYGVAFAWQVTTIEANQKWISPVPRVEDLVDVDRRYAVPTTMYVSRYDVGLLDNPEAVVKRIIERTYPNDQREPLIQWDKVEEPTQGKG